jgi:hypothetical protein
MRIQVTETLLFAVALPSAPKRVGSETVMIRPARTGAERHVAADEAKRA